MFMLAGHDEEDSGGVGDFCRRTNIIGGSGIGIQNSRALLFGQVQIGLFVVLHVFINVVVNVNFPGVEREG